MTEIPTKWEYLGQRCMDDGVPAAAAIAENINNLINALGYKRTTPGWDRDITSGTIDRMGKKAIAYTPRYCVPCTTEGGCSDCVFRECGGSRLFASFMKIVKED